MLSRLYKIFHKPGYKNSKGDAPYDFTCDSSHLCPHCQTKSSKIKYQISQRRSIKIQQKNEEERQQKLEGFRKLYYSGNGQNCKCQNNEICKKCVEVIQERVLTLERGCGAEWIQQFGGMAAGPATVTCKDNYFICDKCEKSLYFFSELNKQYKVEVKHLPKIERYC